MLRLVLALSLGFYAVIGVYFMAVGLAIYLAQHPGLPLWGAVVAGFAVLARQTSPTAPETTP